MLWKLTKTNIYHGKHFMKQFWSYFEVKKEWCSKKAFWKFWKFWNVLKVLNVLKKRFSLSGKVLNEEIKNVFWENQAKALKMFSSWVYEVKHFRKWFWSYFRPKTNILSVWKLCFSFFYTFLNDKVETLF